MAELKHTFVKGRMNKDLDERLIPNGEYRDALNIHISNSEGSDSGAIENVLGNEIVFDLGLTNATCIGTAKDPLNKKIYWFVTSDELNGIYEYDIVNNNIEPVLIDTKTYNEVTINNLRIDPHNEGLILRGLNFNQQKDIFFNQSDVPSYNRTLNQNSEVLCHNSVTVLCEDPELEFYIPKNTIARAANDFIAMPTLLFKGVDYTSETIGGKAFKFKYFTESILNFDSKYFISGANIIDGLLFFTDGLNEPKVIDINKFKYYSSNLKQEDGTIANDSTQVRLYSGDTRILLEEDICVAKKAPQTSPELKMKRTLRDGIVTASGTFNFYKDGALVLPSNEDPTIRVGSSIYPASGWKVGDIIIFEFENEGVEYEATLKLNSIELSNGYPITTYQVVSYNEQPEDIDYDVTARLRESDPIYELKFPRFAYRWKYLDNTYSTFSPFSMPAFIPREFEYDGKKGFNEGVVNDLRKLTLLSIDKGDDTVKSIDILLKFDDDNNVYIVDTKKRDEIEGSTLSFEITKESIKSTVPNLQLLRQWDNIPKKAFAQEIVGNRIIYGNYYQNYNIPYEPKFFVSPVITDGIFKRSIKSNRNYEVGVVYVDKFNRQSPVLASDSSSYFLNKSFSNRNAALSVRLDNLPPAWATHFKFFIKETSAEYYNLAADRMYFDEDNGFCFVSFPSSERDKITNDNYLILKKEHGSDEAVNDINNRYKIIDIFSEPPEFVHEKIEQVGSFTNVLFSPSYGDGNTTTQKTPGSTPTENSVTVQIRSINTLGSADGPTEEGDQGIDDNSKKQLVVGRYVKFVKDNKKSKLYKISNIRYHLGNDDECEIRFDTPFGDDINFIYTEPDNPNSPLEPNIDMRIYIDSANAGDPEFNGRFFVKLETNGLLKDIAEQDKIGDGNVEYYAKYSASFDGIDRNSDNFLRNGTGGIKETPLFMRFGGTVVPGNGSSNGERERIGNKEAHVTLEQTGPVDDDTLLKNIQVGSKLKFSNHDTIYRVGALRVEDFKGPHRNSTTIQLYHIRFENEDGTEQNLTQDIVTHKTDLSPNFLSVSYLAERDEDKSTFVQNPAIFETEPIRQKTDLDIYYENDIAYPISEHNNTHTLNWYNCFNFNNGVESNRIRDDFNAPFIKNGVKASTVLEEGYQEEHKFNGVIWSGIINSKSSVNNSNQFIQAETITKDFLPSYGKIQKLHTWDNAMVILLENKVLRVYANKSQLYDANGNGTLTSTNRVIGDPQEYNGEYGISNDPQSFASFGFRCYFVDRKNGKVLRLSKDGLTPISNVNMNDFFRDRLETDQIIFGSFDERNKFYNISFANDNDTVCFSESVNGWVTRKSFVPQNAVSINSKYFTFSNGNLWKHGSTTSGRNNFYGEANESFVELEINDDPSSIKKFNTLAYEGSEGWTAIVETDQEKSSEISFINKENKYFSNIKGEAKAATETSDNLDLKKFNFQGLGRSSSQEVVEDNRQRTTLSFTVSSSINVTSQTRVLSNLYPGQVIIPTTVSVDINPPNDYKLSASDFSGINCEFNQNGDGVTVTYTHGITLQPNSNRLIEIPIQGGRLIKKEIEVSVTRNVVINNCTNSIGSSTFTIIGRPGEIKSIVTDSFIANEGFDLPTANVSIDNEIISANSAIFQLNNDAGKVQTNESILLQNGTTSISYTVTANAREIIIPNKLLTSKTIDTSDLENNQEQRTLKIIGQPGAIIRYVLNDGSSDIAQETVTISNTGTANIGLDFIATNYNLSKTYTLTFSSGNKTDFAESFGTTSITFTRNEKAQKKLQIKAFHADSVNNAAQTKLYAGFGGQIIQEDEVEFSFTLDSNYDYDIIAQPTSSSFIFSDGNKNNVTISDAVITVDTVNEHIITFKFIVDTVGINFDELITINLDDFVNKKITLTIAYNDPNQGTDYSGLFLNSLSTIQGIAGKANNAFSPIKYKISMLNNKQLLDGEGETALQPDEFKLYDAQTGGDDITETYDDNNELFLTYSNVTVGATIELQPSSFVFPNADTTLYIRPSRDITEDVPATPPNEFILKINGISPLSETYPDTENTGSFRTPIFEGSSGPTALLWPNNHFSNKQTKVITETSSVQNTKRLVQFTYKIDRGLPDSRYLHISKWAEYSNSNYSLLQADNNIVEEAAAGTYTDIDGDSVNIDGAYILSNNNLTLTVNLLIDIEYITTNNITFSDLSIRTPIDHSPDSYISSGADGNSAQYAFNTKNDACDSLGNSFLWKVYNPDAKAEAPKYLSFISGELSPRNQNARIASGGLSIVAQPHLGDHYRSPIENQYFKDFTNSKIYKLNNNGLIVEVMDLCLTGFDNTKIITSLQQSGSWAWEPLTNGFNFTPITSENENYLFTNIDYKMEVPGATDAEINFLKSQNRALGFGITVRGNGAAAMLSYIKKITINERPFSSSTVNEYAYSIGESIPFRTAQFAANFSRIYIDGINFSEGIKTISLFMDREDHFFNAISTNAPYYSFYPASYITTGKSPNVQVFKYNKKS